jgi:hypothetical protein
LLEFLWNLVSPDCELIIICVRIIIEQLIVMVSTEGSEFPVWIELSLHNPPIAIEPEAGLGANCYAIICDRQAIRTIIPTRLDGLEILGRKDTQTDKDS